MLKVLFIKYNQDNIFLKEGEVPNTTLKLDGCDYDGLTQLLVKMCEVYKLNIRHGQPYG